MPFRRWRGEKVCQWVSDDVFRIACCPIPLLLLERPATAHQNPWTGTFCNPAFDMILEIDAV
jgi:hypothetical protein